MPTFKDYSGGILQLPTFFDAPCEGIKAEISFSVDYPYMGTAAGTIPVTLRIGEPVGALYPDVFSFTFRPPLDDGIPGSATPSGAGGTLYLSGDWFSFDLLNDTGLQSYVTWQPVGDIVETGSINEGGIIYHKYDVAIAFIITALPPIMLLR